MLLQLSPRDVFKDLEEDQHIRMRLPDAAISNYSSWSGHVRLMDVSRAAGRK